MSRRGDVRVRFLNLLTRSLFWLQLCVIKSFGDTLTEKIFSGEKLTKKERKQIGALKVEKAETRLDQLDTAEEKDLLLAPHLHYHNLKGTNRYSIDADSRKSPWRITFEWEDDEMKDVLLVEIEDTH